MAISISIYSFKFTDFLRLFIHRIDRVLPVRVRLFIAIEKTPRGEETAEEIKPMEGVEHGQSDDDHRRR